MFKKNRTYEVLSWEELLEKADSNFTKDNKVYSLLFNDCDYGFVSAMKFLCGYRIHCESNCEYIERDGYKIYSVFCKEINYVNHPKHYNASKYETIDIIESLGWGTGFNLGNAIKYIMRCEHKENKEADLKKAIWYLQRELKEEK